MDSKEVPDPQQSARPGMVKEINEGGGFESVVDVVNSVPVQDIMVPRYQNRIVACPGYSVSFYATFYVARGNTVTTATG